MVQSQLDGLIETRPVERGDFVEAGDLLCQISTEDRQARLVEARAQVEQSELLYRVTRNCPSKDCYLMSACQRAELSSNWLKQICLGDNLNRIA